MATQHGLIHRDQARALGMSSSAVHRRIKAGVWARHYRCVYGVTAAPATFEQRVLAACLAVGPAAIVSHASAAAMWRWCPERTPIHITVPGQVTARPNGLVIHRTTRLLPSDVGKLRSVRVTSPARTLIDLAATLAETELDEILQHAVSAGCVLPDKLRARVAAARGKGSTAAATLSRILPPAEQRPSVTTSLERAVASILSEAGPSFVREHPVHADGRVFYVDFAFPHLKVAVEADGRRWHSDATAFERDRIKHNALLAAGWKVLRVTERQVRTDPGAIRDRVRDLVVRG